MAKLLNERPLLQGVLGNFIFQILWILGGVVISAITAYSAYLSEIPLYLIILITIAIFCVSVWALYGLALLANWQRERAEKTEEANIAPDAEKDPEIDELKGEIEALKQKYQGEKIILEKHADEIEAENIRIKKAWDKDQWLRDLAEMQSLNIDDYVHEGGIFYLSKEFEHGTPNIQFFIKIFNASIFNIAFDNKIEGDIKFRDSLMRCDKHFLHPPPHVIAAGQETELVFELHLTDAQLDVVKKAPKSKKSGQNINQIDFGFGGMKLLITGYDFEEVISKHLKIPVNRSVDIEDQLKEYL